MFTYLNESRTFYYLCHHYKIGSHLIVPEHGEEKGSLMTHIWRQMCRSILFESCNQFFQGPVLCSAIFPTSFAQERNPWLSFFSLVLTFTRRPAWPDFSPQSWIPGRISLDPRDLSNPLTFKCSNQLLGFPLKGSKFLCPNSKHHRPYLSLVPSSEFLYLSLESSNLGSKYRENPQKPGFWAAGGEEVGELATQPGDAAEISN